ncbi:MAG: hypothetical protein AAGA57_02660 [Planctomycetota bacterium]
MTRLSGQSRPAPAKLNLALAVDPPDAAGMHPLATWAVGLDFGDEVSFTPEPADEPALVRRLAGDAPVAFDCDWPAEQDLVSRARTALQARVGRSVPGRIELTKRIPPGAGLGGGSADAAATLALLNHAHGLGVSHDELDAIAAPLGADIPLCAALARDAGSRLATGYGHQLEPAPMPPWRNIILLLTHRPTPTGPVYQAFDGLLSGGGSSKDARARVDAIVTKTLDSGRLPVANELEAAARNVQPRIGHALDALRSADLDAHLTGSGSTLFLTPGEQPLPDPQAAAAIAGEGWVGQAARVLPPR